QADVALDVVGADAVHHHAHPLDEFGFVRQGHHDPHHVAQAAQFELGQQQDHVGQPQGRQVGRDQRLAQVQDQVRVADPQQVNDAGQVVLVNDADIGDVERMGQQVQAGALVLHHRALQVVHVQAFDVQGQVGQRVVRHQVQGDVGIAQGHVQVEQNDAVL